MALPRGKHLHFDAPAGIAGDMALGALLDLGVDLARVKAVLATLPVHGYEIRVEECRRGGLRGLDLKVHFDPHHHHHDHHDHAHEHRHYGEIRAMLAGLPDAVRTRAEAAFERIARAEAHLHGKTVDEVAFHEVGAIDSIVDIVGTAAALAELAPASISCTPLPLGHGTVTCAHGLLPVPAPATLEIVRAANLPVHDGGAAFELTTPTGATLAAFAGSFGPAPAGRVLAIGWGAGDRELPDRPNLLRAVLVDPLVEASSDTVVHLEANLDDLSPELCEHVAERLFAAGALDVWWQPVVMKKSRPAVILGVIAPPDKLDALAGLVFAETSTIGLRHQLVARRVLERRIDTIHTRYGAIRVKRAFLAGRQVNVAPEYEDCKAAAKAHEVPLKLVYAAALAGAS